MKAFISPILVLLILGSFYGYMSHKDYKENQPRFAAGQCIRYIEREGNEFESPTHGYLKVLEVGKVFYKVEVYLKLFDSRHSSFISTRHISTLNKNANEVLCSELEAAFN